MSTAERRMGIAPLLVAGAAAVAVATLGGLLTEIGPWYRALQKPSFQPPDWVFGPVWTTLYAMIAVAAALAWRAAPDRPTRSRVAVLFTLNAVLNVGWSLCFFHLQRPDWALAEIAVLWLSIVSLIVVCARLSRVAAWLLVPYLCWVSFAAALNLAIVRLN